ncbi:MAG: anaerobic glycerol-3-phosphate dehydrogenase subunit C [Eubacteriales bacterium]
MKLENFDISAFDDCAKCSICVENCPVTKVNPEFPGPKQLGPDWLRIAQKGELIPNPAVNYCTNCKNCEISCPSGILVASLNQLSKLKLPPKRVNIRLRDSVFANPAFLGKMTRIWPQGVNFFMGLGLFRSVAEKTIGIAAKTPMPAYSKKTFSQLFKGYEQKISLNKKVKEVLFFPGCFTKYNKPEIGMSLVKILNKLNYKVIAPEFKCCGQPAISSSRLDNTEKFAKYNLNILRQYLKKDTPMLFVCPSCLLTFKEEYINILGLEEYAEFTSVMKDAGQFLLEHEDELATFITKEGKQKMQLAYHEPCHLKASGLGTPGLSLLNNVAGFNIVPLEAGCCGISGSYGLKAEKQWISKEIGKNIKDALDEIKPKAAVTECGMCSVQIGNIGQIPVYHPVVLLAELIKD